MTDTTKKRPEFRNINPISDLTTYRLPVAAKLSILHRASGLVMFFLLPFVIWLLDTSISSEFSYARFTAAFNTGAGLVHQIGRAGPDLVLPAPLLRWPAPHLDGRVAQVGQQRVWQELGPGLLCHQPAADRHPGRQAVRSVLIARDCIH